ncbi:MAG: hypothetical protein Q3M24_13420 [Candidatus Electrothrix aestuarii]|uniref:Lipoprotein n=1 Tax=Candidatus Electrothrix aestuarii TaxID=3062594 RepID=A0AAU8LP92_9BACT|nr:hypothetical protein [Candidatus Electrothrix aestuarii]WPD24678.1 MAG: hypothetical protein SD837_08965 [Candidatus Electrothrix sp. GW3-3]
MKKLSIFLSLAVAATILSGCYVSPYGPYYRGYAYKGAQCPPPIKVNVDITKKKEEEKKKEEKKPECKPKPSCDCPPVYKPVCPYPY